ncbi:MAG: type transport system ATP-binding protein [Actinomycetota bacterium]|nr:type transport system ATP-binding protein [Actinomycetota bacterium]
MSDLAIKVSGLRKSYGDFEALRGIDLEVANGEVFALLGPNGAGKTTAVEIMEGHRKRTAGDVRVLGFDPSSGSKAFKERIGIVLQETGIEPFLTVAEVIDLYRGYYPHPRPRDEIIEVVGLVEKRDERVAKLSGGQQRRLDVAVGLAGDPDLLFLDEPTTGFDPSARRNAWEMIGNLVDLGKTVFLTTHYMDEAQHLAGRVAIIVDGQIVAEGPPGSLVGTSSAATKISFRHTPALERLPKELIPGAATANGRVELHTDEPMRILHELTRWVLEQQTELEDLNVSRPSLEDVYLELTSDAQRVGIE